MLPMIPPDTDLSQLALQGARKLGRGRVKGMTATAPSPFTDGPVEQWYLETGAGRIPVDSVANWASYGNGRTFPTRTQVIVLNVQGYFFACVRDWSSGPMDNMVDVYGVFKSADDAHGLKGVERDG